MPTNRTRRRRNRVPEVPPEALVYFETGDAADWPNVHFDPDRGKRLWELAREAMVEAWAAKHPGTRPWAWWRWDAPEPRRRVGGTGTPAHEVLAHLPWHQLGIPVSWITPREVEFYGTGFHGVAVDPDDPPAFESQGEYLKRHGLLLDGEKPGSLDPEFITMEGMHDDR